MAIVTRGGSEDGMRYVHADHLGSVDALTDEDGSMIERRSYGPFRATEKPSAERDSSSRGLGASCCHRRIMSK